MHVLKLNQVYTLAHTRLANVCGCLGREVVRVDYASVEASSPPCVTVLVPLIAVEQHDHAQKYMEVLR
jgi:hypothetical protein